MAEDKKDEGGKDLEEFKTQFGGIQNKIAQLDADRSKLVQNGLMVQGIIAYLEQKDKPSEPAAESKAPEKTEKKEKPEPVKAA